MIEESGSKCFYKCMNSQIYQPKHKIITKKNNLNQINKSLKRKIKSLNRRKRNKKEEKVKKMKQKSFQMTIFKLGLLNKSLDFSKE